MVTATKQQQTKPPADPVADAEQTVAQLQEKREKLLAERSRIEGEMGKHSFAAHARSDMRAVEALDQIATDISRLDARVREIDLAIATANRALLDARQAERQAVDQARAEELRKHVDELSRVPAYIEKHLADALRGLIAFERGVAELHQLGVAFPTDVQLRLGMTAVLGTWLQQLPKLWWNEIAAGLRFRAPAERKSAISYWTQLEPSLRNAIRQATGEAEQPNKERAA
jgi:hypothetical protein